MDDETQVKLLKRTAAVLGALIVIVFSMAAVFGYYNCTTERPAKELFFEAEGQYEDHSARPEQR